MVGRNLAALQRVYAGWAEGNMSAELSIYDEHIVVIAPDPYPVASYGVEGMSAYMRTFLESWGDLRFEAREYRAVGDTVLVRTRRSGVGKESGAPIDDEVFHVWTFRGTKAIRIEVVADEATALHSAGVEV